MIVIYDYICTRLYLYTVAICTDGTIMNICSSLQLVAILNSVSLASHFLLLKCINMNIV